MKKITLILFVILLLPFTSAKQYHMKLLAVKDTPYGYEGSSADLYLEIMPGKGRVFLDTFPLTKVDTQISTRFAKDIACDYLDIECNNHDFFYTITADSSIIGGPSAGAAISILTIASLKNIDIDDDIAITGTINSGGIIGPIGGVKAKIEAAKSSGLKKVIIPMGERFVKKDEISNKTLNKTIDLVEYGKELGLEVIEAPDLDTALLIFTGRILISRSDNVEIDELYTNTMQMLSFELCNRSDYLYSSLPKMELRINNETNQTLKSVEDLINNGADAYNNSKYYSAGSYCFGANVRLSYLILLRKNLSNITISDIIHVLEENIKGIDKKLSALNIKTITDLESFMAVKERLIESQELLERAKLSSSQKEMLYNLAFSSERLNSAIAWLKFLDNRGKVFSFNKQLLENSCKKRLSEVEEQFQYIGTLIPLDLSTINQEITSAYNDLNNKFYELCLYKASKAKAEINTVISSLSIDESQIDTFISHKLKITKSNIAKETKNGIFPILGYSYYEYADSLKDTDKYSALLYSEYAMELSNLDIYFKNRERLYLYNFDYGILIVLVSSSLTSFLGGVIITAKYYKRKKKKRRTN